MDFGFGIPAPESKIQTPQNPESKIPKIQNPKYEALGPHIKNCYITIQNPKSKIQKFWPKKFGLGILDCGFWIWDSGPRIQNPNSPKSKIQNPKSPKSKIQNPQNPKSPKSKIQNLKSPKTKIQNPPPKSKIWGVGGLT